MSSVYQKSKTLSASQLRRKKDAIADAALFNAPIDLIKTEVLIELRGKLTKQQSRLVQNELTRRGCRS